jgi:hypothetical protein
MAGKVGIVSKFLNLLPVYNYLQKSIAYLTKYMYCPEDVFLPYNSYSLSYYRLKVEIEIYTDCK